MFTRSTTAVLCLLGLSMACGLTGCRGTEYRIGHSRTACRQEQYNQYDRYDGYDGTTPSPGTEYNPAPSQSVPGRVGPSLAPPADRSSKPGTRQPRQITPPPTKKPVPAPSATQSERGAFGTVQRTAPMKLGARSNASVRDHQTGPNFGPQNPIAEPVESQRKLFPRPTNMPRVFEGMRQRLRQVFHRDATVQTSPSTLFHRRGSVDQAPGANTRPVAYRRSLPLSGLNGREIQQPNGLSATSPLVELGTPEPLRNRMGRADGSLTAVDGTAFLMPPRQAGPSSGRPPLMTVPLDDEPLEMWPHSPAFR